MPEATRFWGGLRIGSGGVGRLLGGLKHRFAVRECPVCGQQPARFEPFGVSKTRSNARCTRCGSLERHRLVWLFMRDRTDLFDGGAKRLLHFAPETSIGPLLAERLGSAHVTADLRRADVDVRMDITKIPHPDACFDAIYCSHVLEHVPDDGRAMRELRRVLKPGGWAILMVPMKGPTTREDPSITDPAERTRLFGQHDHVRRYGADFSDRLRAAGFRVETTVVRERFSEAERARYGLRPGGAIHYCTKS